MSRKKNKCCNPQSNFQFIDSAIINDSTYADYLDRFKKICLSMFEWVNLPSSMSSMWLERSLYYFGMASLLYDENLGYINTNCSSQGDLNIYGLPNKLRCYSFEYQTTRRLYTGLKDNTLQNKQCILVQNNWERSPTCGSMELFALRLTDAQRTCDINISSQKTPVVLVVDERQRIMLENLYNQYAGNRPFIFGDNKQLDAENMLKAINTNAPYVADKITDYKKEIWNEALTFLRY